MFENYLPRIQEFLGTRDLEIQDTDFGKVAIKGNWTPSRSIGSTEICGFDLDLSGGRVLHERVLYVERDIPIRSHEEESDELIMNLTHESSRIYYATAPNDLIELGDMALHGGFFHGFTVEQGPGLLYIAKALLPDFVEGNSFRMPENTYREG